MMRVEQPNSITDAMIVVQRMTRLFPRASPDRIEAEVEAWRKLVDRLLTMDFQRFCKAAGDSSCAPLLLTGWMDVKSEQYSWPNSSKGLATEM